MMRKLAILLIIPVLLTLPLFIALDDTSHAQSNVVAFLKVDNADVELQRANTDLWVKLNIETIIGVEDKIRTNGTGRATLTYFGDELEVEIHPNTEVHINEIQQNFDGYKASIHVVKGNISQQVLMGEDSNSAYEFTTDSVSVFMQEGSSELFVEDNGAVAVLSGNSPVFVSSTAGLVEIPANHGVRTDDEGVLSSVLPVSSVEQLDSAIDGLTVTFSTESDIQVNVRKGPDKANTRLGNALPADLVKVHGISSDGDWYRVPFGTGYGWVSSVGLDVTTNDGALVVFANDYVEVDAQATAAVAAPPPSAAEQGVVAETTDRLPQYLDDYSEEELALIAGMNQWRLEAGVAPLQPNAILTRMARDQAGYLMSFPSIPNDLHKDAKGRYPRERGASADYRWPYYGQSARIAVGENAYVGHSVTVAVNWWKNSEIHRTAALNSGYREIGVAAIPHPFGHLYIVVFGSRPNVFPVMFDPATGRSYVTTEQYQYSSGGDWLNTVQDVQQVATVLTQLDENGWLLFGNEMDLPSNQSYVIAFRGDAKVVVIEIDPVNSTVILPQTLETFLTMPEPEVIVPATPAPPLFPTNTPAP